MKSFNFVASFLALAIVLGCTATTQAVPFDLETKITADDGSAGDFFGRSVAISGNTVVVGASGDDDAGRGSGSAYLFDVTTGNQTKLTADDAEIFEQFGSSVAISGNTAIVGAWFGDAAGSRSGSAYLFDATTGSQLAKLTATDAAADDRFGRSVAISGNTAIVGAWFDDDGGSDSGSAYLFDVFTGSQIAKLTATDAATDDLFGGAVAINGNMAIVGAVRNDDGGSNSGSAYLFDVATGEQIAKLTATDAAADDLFGASVAINGSVAIVGAVRDDDGGSNSGSAYLFDVTTGEQIAKLTADDAVANDLFGSSVAISGNTVIVGASESVFDSGSAYLFDLATGNQIAKLTADDARGGDRFGVSVSISGNTAIVGAWRDGDAGINSGSAYLFENIPEPSTLLLGTMAVLGLSMRRNRAS